MSTVAPQPGFDYDAIPDKGTWTRKYILKAYPQSYRLILEEFFAEGSALVVQHKIFTNSTLSRKDLASLRMQHSQTLMSHFNDRLAVQGHPNFLEQISLGFITYAATLTRKDSAGTVRKSETPVKEETPRSAIRSIQNHPIQSHPLPPPGPWRLQDFRINCLPYRYSVTHTGLALKAGDLREQSDNPDMQLEDIRLSILLSELELAGLISSASDAALTYKGDNDRIMGIRVSKQLQQAVDWHCMRGQIFMEVGILTQDDWATLQPPSLMPTGPLFSPPLAHISPSKPQADFIPGGLGTRSKTLSIRSKKSGPVSEADPFLYKPPSSKRATPTPSNPSSSDSDAPSQPSPTKKLKSLLFDKAKGPSFDKAKRLSVVRESQDSQDEDPIRPYGHQQQARTYSESSKASPQPHVSEVGEDEVSGEEDENPEVPVDRANGDIDDEDLEAQYIKLLSRMKFLVNLFRFRRSADDQLCEQLQGEMWVRAAKFFGISRTQSSTSIDKHLIPGMRKALYHWQVLCVFVSILFNSGTHDRYGALIGDEMGLGKTWEAIALAVFHQQLWQQWQHIRKEWANPPPDHIRRHCKADAAHEDTCPTASWTYPCPCEPSSECHHIRPVNGPSIFFVPTSSLHTWMKELRDLVDFDKLGVKLLVMHSSVLDSKVQATSNERLALKTIIDRTDPESRPPLRSAINNSKQRGFSSAESSNFWILTTWNTWHNTMKSSFIDKHRYKYQKDGQTVHKEEDIHRFHCGLAIIDECHIVKNIGKGPWGLLRQMKTDRPMNRFWFAALSGTILNANPTDIIGPIDIIGSKGWVNTQHPYHSFCEVELKKMGKAVEKSTNDQTDANIQAAAQQCIKTFGRTLPNFLIRRTEMSRWNGEPLIELKPLYQKKINTKFPLKFQAAFANSLKKWAKDKTAELAARQATWAENCRKNHAYAAQNEKPMTVDADRVLGSARTLRLVSDLPFLSTITSARRQKWDNITIQNDCQDTETGQMKPKCILDEYYKDIIQDCPKLMKVEQLIIQHKKENILILSHFPEVLLVVERYIREHKKLNRNPQMYFGSTKKREEAKAAFQLETNPESGERLHAHEPDILIGLVRTMGTGLTLHRASVVIIMEPMYDPNLFLQIPKRAHRLGQTKEVWCYTIRTDTSIEDLVEERRKKRSGFGEQAFLKVLEGQDGGKNDGEDVEDEPQFLRAGPAA